MSVAYNYSVNWVNRDNLAPGTPAKTASAADIEAELIAIRASFQLAAATVNESHTGNTSFENVSISGNSTLGNATATSATVGAFTMEIDGVDLVISHG
ncbi:MAG: hypothetical protein MJH10_21090, partial [Epibacterium sp.]|nr:hypothetical protein [Epibacterium sp.]NQX75952.1 hypothetical protein [Epibacterium sp.]